jgi:hypothetical protein
MSSQTSTTGKSGAADGRNVPVAMRDDRNRNADRDQAVFDRGCSMFIGIIRAGNPRIYAWDEASALLRSKWMSQNDQRFCHAVG